MKATLRFLVVPVFALAAVACGTGPTKVESGSPSAGVSASANSAAAAATTTTVPKAKTTPLAELDEIPGSLPLETGTLKVNAQILDNSLYGYACMQPAIAWDLNKAYTKLTATIGVDDWSNPADQVTVTFKADGNQVASSVVKLGTTAPVEFDVTNVLRLTAEVKSSGVDCDPSIGRGTRFAIADAQLTPKG